MRYTVKQLADLADVTPRTLHYYDAIGLLPPAAVGDNGYRRYDDASALRLQQIRFYRELGMSLSEIHAALDRPDFDVAAALRAHRQALLARAKRLEQLIATIDRTLLHLQGELTMDTKDLFAGFDEETQARYAEEAATMYDPQTVAAAGRRWQSYSAADRARIQGEGGAIYQELAALLDRDPADPAVQAVVARWHEHLRAFYEPTADILRGLGQAYAEDPRFAAFFTALHPDLPDFLRRAIERYTATLTD